MKASGPEAMDQWERLWSEVEAWHLEPEAEVVVTGAITCAETRADCYELLEKAVGRERATWVCKMVFPV